MTAGNWRRFSPHCPAWSIPRPDLSGLANGLKLAAVHNLEAPEAEAALAD